MKKITLDQVEKINIYQRSGVHGSSCCIDRHLHIFEHRHYQRALEKGYLDISDKDQPNLWHIWEKECLAQNKTFLVLIKDTMKSDASIYRDQELLGQYPLKEARQYIQQLAALVH